MSNTMITENHQYQLHLPSEQLLDRIELILQTIDNIESHLNTFVASDGLSMLREYDSDNDNTNNKHQPLFNVDNETYISPWLYSEHTLNRVINLFQNQLSQNQLYQNIDNIDMRLKQMNAVDALIMLSKDVSEKTDNFNYNHTTNEMESDENNQLFDNDADNDNVNNNIDYEDDGKYGYYESRLADTLMGWYFTVHPKSICLTPPPSWHEIPKKINVSWYKRPLFYSNLHNGYFLSNSQVFLDKIRELGAVFDNNN